MLHINGKNFVKNFFQITKKEITEESIPLVRERIKNLVIEKVKNLVEERLDGEWWRIDELKKEKFDFFSMYEMSKEVGFFNNFDYIADKFILENLNEILKNLEIKKDVITKKEVRKFYSYLIQQIILVNMKNLKVEAEGEDYSWKSQEIIKTFLASKKVIMATTMNKNSSAKRDDLVYKKIEQNAIVEHDWKVFLDIYNKIKRNAYCSIDAKEILEKKWIYGVRSDKAIHLDLLKLKEELEIYQFKVRKW